VLYFEIYNQLFASAVLNSLFLKPPVIIHREQFVSVIKMNNHEISYVYIGFYVECLLR